MSNISRQLKQFARDNRDEALGRIRFDAAHWVYSINAPPPEDETDAQTRLKQLDATGVMMVLVRGRGTWCKHPQWANTHPKVNTGNYNVPYGDCTKCSYYLKGGKKIRFPRCLWAAKCQTTTEARIVAAIEAIDTLEQAFNDANRIINE